MRKKILFQTAAIITVFMIALLGVLSLIISNRSTRIFTVAKQDMLDRDLRSLCGELFMHGYCPELLNYCKTHPETDGTDILSDPKFKQEYDRLFPGILEKGGVDAFKKLDDEIYLQLTPEEKYVYACMWLYFLNDSVDLGRNYYGFHDVAVIDVSRENFGRVFSAGNQPEAGEREMLESFIADDEKRNGTLSKAAAPGEETAQYGIAYGDGGQSLYMGYFPMQPITEESGYVICITTDLKAFNSELAGQIQQILIFCLIVFAVFATLLIWFLNHKIVRPVTQIQKSVRKYTDDKDTPQFVAEIRNVRVNNEIGILAGDVSDMAEKIERYTAENIGLVTERERIRTEMNLARTIQASALPEGFLPDRKEFSLYAVMNPARQVGGDFYDFFLTDSDHLALVIADVSGKGIPAALFMMTTKSLIRDQLMNGLSPAEALARVNAQLAEGNTSMMFVTVWLAVLEISTGKITACNAGHEHPVLRRAGGEFELLTYKHDKFVGPFAKMTYQNRDFELLPGDCIFVYTDGVPEAKNSANEMFGTERMLEALNGCADAEPEILVKNMYEMVNRFAGEEEQFDDITMLCFRYFGPQPPEEA